MYDVRVVIHSVDSCSQHIVYTQIMINGGHHMGVVTFSLQVRYVLNSNYSNILSPDFKGP